MRAAAALLSQSLLKAGPQKWSQVTHQRCTQVLRQESCRAPIRASLPAGGANGISLQAAAYSAGPKVPNTNVDIPDIPPAASTSAQPPAGGSASSAASPPAPDTNVGATSASTAPRTPNTNVSPNKQPVSDTNVGATSASTAPRTPNTNVSPSTQPVSDSSQSTYSGPPRLVVFGGNGFVGSRVCQEGLKTGLAVASVNRSGAPKLDEPWVREVEWVRADVFQPEVWRSQLQGGVGVVSCLGAFGSNDFMLKINGEANVTVIREASAAGVPRCAFISVHDYGLPDFVLSGYFKGKRNAELAMAETYGENGVSLRPGFIYGTRRVSGVGVPLGAIGFPLDKLLQNVPTKRLAGVPLAGAAFVPPVSVQAVAKAAVAAATDPSVPSGVMDVWAIHEYSHQL